MNKVHVLNHKIHVIVSLLLIYTNQRENNVTIFRHIDSNATSKKMRIL